MFLRLGCTGIRHPRHLTRKGRKADMLKIANMDKREMIRKMSRVWIVILLLVGSIPGQGCPAMAACACFSTSRDIHAPHQHPAPHNSARCKTGSCGTHGDRSLARETASESRNEREHSDRRRSSISHPVTAASETSSVFIRSAALLFSHPFPEAAPPSFMIKCVFLC